MSYVTAQFFACHPVSIDRRPRGLWGYAPNPCLRNRRRYVRYCTDCGGVRDHPGFGRQPGTRCGHRNRSRHVAIQDVGRSRCQRRLVASGQASSSEARAEGGAPAMGERRWHSGAAARGDGHARESRYVLKPESRAAPRFSVTRLARQDFVVPFRGCGRTSEGNSFFNAASFGRSL